MGGGKELAAIRAQMRCAGILYAGARKGIFSPEESIECLQDSRERLDALLERMTRMKKKANRVRKAIRKYLREIQKGGSLEIQFSPGGAEELDSLVPNSPPKREPPRRRKAGMGGTCYS
jgi:hypothetical protein